MSNFDFKEQMTFTPPFLLVITTPITL